MAAAFAASADVYVAAGVYEEAVEAAGGVGIYGGYAADWSRALSNVSEIRGVPQGLLADGDVDWSTLGMVLSGTVPAGASAVPPGG